MATPLLGTINCAELTRELVKKLTSSEGQPDESDGWFRVSGVDQAVIADVERDFPELVTCGGETVASFGPVAVEKSCS